MPSVVVGDVVVDSGEDGAVDVASVEEPLEVDDELVPVLALVALLVAAELVTLEDVPVDVPGLLVVEVPEESMVC